MTIQLKRIGFIVLLVVGILEAWFLKEGSVIAVGTVFAVASIHFLLNILGIKVVAEKSNYIKDLKKEEKILAIITLMLILAWAVSVIIKF